VRARQFEGPTPTDTNLAAMRQVDAQSTDALRRMILLNGWPGLHLVGEDGAEAAWLLTMWSDLNRDFQREALDVLKRAVAAHDAPTHHAAFLADRLAMHDGQPQTYGTAYALDASGLLVCHPVEDREQLDALRASVSLPPWGTRDATMRLLYGGHEVRSDPQQAR
jgi:hypothetical protein